MSYFKEKFTLEERKEKFKRLHEKYPDIFLVVCEYSGKPAAETSFRLRCLPNYTISSLKSEVMRRIEMKSDETLYLYIKKYSPANNVQLLSLYEKYKDEDGFLYFEFAKEATYGVSSE